MATVFGIYYRCGQAFASNALRLSIGGSMSQLYLLSVVTLLFGGALAASDLISRKVSGLAILSDLAEHRNLVITVGAITALVGVVKLFLRAPFDGVPVAGDLLPAIAGIAAGGVLILGQTTQPEPSDETAPARTARTFLNYRNPVGLAAAAVGLLHFLFASVVIL